MFKGRHHSKTSTFVKSAIKTKRKEIHCSYFDRKTMKRHKVNPPGQFSALVKNLFLSVAGPFRTVAALDAKRFDLGQWNLVTAILRCLAMAGTSITFKKPKVLFVKFKKTFKQKLFNFEREIIIKLNNAYYFAIHYSGMSSERPCWISPL